MSIVRVFGFAFSVALLIIAALVPSSARTIHFPDDSRRCLSTSIVPNGKLDNASACIAHNSCSRTVFATFEAYPFRVRHNHAPTRVKISHWIGPGDREVFGWNGTNLNPVPECAVVETHY